MTVSVKVPSVDEDPALYYDPRLVSSSPLDKVSGEDDDGAVSYLGQDEEEDYELYDAYGRTPPRTRVLNNRKWKDNKKHMNELAE